MIQGMRDYQQEAVDKTIKDLNSSASCAPLIALPTGAGKTYVIAGLIDAMLKDDPDASVLVIAHVKEILMQNRESIEGVLHQSVSTYSAGLGTKQIGRITVAGIQSIYKDPDIFRDFSLILIDEAHLIPAHSEGMYRTFLAEMIYSRVVGLTATPFRMSTGYIYGKERIFSHLSIDLTNFAGFNRLLDNGYLCRLTSKSTALQLRTEGVKITGGDFNERALSEANNRSEITTAAIDEILDLGKNRKKILIFAIDIKHAENIVEELKSRDTTAEYVHSKMDKDRDGIIRRFKENEFRCLVNVNILTTGFDDPSIDLVVLLRPTQSPVLHVQTIGRGLRIHHDKSDCMVLDFAGNISRLGCINDIQVKEKKKRKKDPDAEPRAKECPECLCLLPPRVMVCECGYHFPIKEKILREAAWDNPIKESKRTTKAWFQVYESKFSRYTKYGSPPMIKASFDLGGKTVHKYVCVEHSGWAKTFADAFTRSLGLPECSTVEEFVRAVESATRTPAKLLIETEGKYPEILEIITKKNTMTPKSVV